MHAPDRADPPAARADGRARRPSRRTLLALAALTAVAVLLRCTGVGFMLPHVAQIDERVLYYQLGAERGIAPPESKRANLVAYPTLIAKSLHVVMGDAAECQASTTEEHLACASGELVRMRTWLAIVASLGVPLLFFLTRRFTSDRVALLAAALFAFSILNGWFSPQARPHTTLSTLAVLAMIACVDLRRRGDARSYVLAGLATALVCATLQSGFLVLPALLLAHFLRRRGGTRHSWLWFAVAGAIIAAGVLGFYGQVATPRVDGGSGTGLFDRLLGRIHAVDLSEFNAQGFAALLQTVVDYEPVIGVLTALGIVALLVRSWRGLDAFSGDRGRDAIVVMAYPVAHVIAFGLYDRTFQRFLIPVVPYLCMLAAFGLATVARALGERAAPGWPRRLVQTLVVVVALVPQVSLAVKIAWLRQAPDTITRAADWIRANVDREHDRVAVSPTLDLPLVRTREEIPTRLTLGEILFAPWPDYQVTLTPEQRDPIAWSLFQVPLFNRKQREDLMVRPAEFVRDLGARYVVVDVIHDDRRHILGLLRSALHRQGRLVAHFGPREPTRDDDLPILYELNGPMAADKHFAWRAAHYAAQGPDIEIYALDP